MFPEFMLLSVGDLLFSNRHHVTRKGFSLREELWSPLFRPVCPDAATRRENEEMTGSQLKRKSWRKPES